MDRKQTRIYNDILDKFNLPLHNVKFVQHRNLTEFKYFEIEKINPTHIIKLYGSLKNNNKKKDISKHLINVGEIIIGFTTFSLNIKILLMYSDFILLTLSMYFINCFLFYFFGKFKILGVGLIDNWYRGFSWRWKNHIYGKMS